MNRKKRRQRLLVRKRAWLVLAGTALCLLAARDSSSANRVVPLPRLRAGQTLRYQIYARVQRVVKTESRVTAMMKPPELNEDISVGLQITIREVRMENGRPVITAHGEFEWPKNAGGTEAASLKPAVDFTIDGAGQVRKVEGLENLDAEQRLVWQFWMARFAYGWTLPAGGVKHGERWKTEEAEQTPGPIANLVWQQETTYGKNDKCAIVPTEKCAVFFTTARLKQKSSPKDTTPEDYKLHDLKTSGTASGTNEAFTSVSLKTGLMLRATEDGKQSMNVEIAKTDGTNQVKYQIDANSHFEVVFVPASDSRGQ
jgi:hypothetical protein